MLTSHLFKNSIPKESLFLLQNLIISNIPSEISVFKSNDNKTFLDSPSHVTHTPIFKDTLIDIIYNHIPHPFLIYYRTLLESIGSIESNQHLISLVQSILERLNTDNYMNEPTLIHQSPIPSLSNLSNCQLWMSMQFSTTPLHYDKCNGLLIQLKGKKRFIIFSIHQAQDLYLNNIGPLQGSRLMNLNEYYGKPYPQAWEVDKPIMESEKKEFMERVFVRFKGLIPIVYDLDEGDVLYTPAGWMHEVISVTDSVSITIPWDMNKQEISNWEQYF